MFNSQKPRERAVTELSPGAACEFVCRESR
jgi:hypothetical protein